MIQLANTPLAPSSRKAGDAGFGEGELNTSPVSRMAGTLIGSEVLRIASEVRALTSTGRKVFNLTVGDFAPSQYRIPKFLEKEIAAALSRGETNYPPSDGIPELRKSVQSFYDRHLGLNYPVESVLIASGARAVMYATFRAILDPGDSVVYPVPSWNNNHYAHLCQARGVPIASRSEDSFLPTRASLQEAVRGATLLSLNSPLNPTGTVFKKEVLREICEMVVEENLKREKGHRLLSTEGTVRPLMLMFDQVYWMLTFGGAGHYHPVEVCPEIRDYTIYIDGISKAFAATGVRVGWAAGPLEVIRRMSDIIGHMGAWAPKAEQVATAKLLDNDEVIHDYQEKMKGEISGSLEVLYEEIMKMKNEGYSVDCIPPMGAIYLSVRFRPNPSPEGMGVYGPLQTNEEIRKFLLNEASLAVVPFQAFGDPEENGWFRLSVGAVSKEDIREMIQALRAAMDRLK